jgi:2-polyprenyl-3-methyl-5-hydroxy-6-metoxy-1,4-benzoquinol methylase
MTCDNPWNKLSGVFAGDESMDHVPAEAADNILIAWPVILDFIAENVNSKREIRVLDYGCGGGRFAAELRKLGYQTYGVDTADELISSAHNHYGEQVVFEVGDESIVANYMPLDIITSIMTFEFIADIEKTVAVLSSTLTPGGIFIFATHNPEYVANSIRLTGSPYHAFENNNKPASGQLRFGEINIPIHLRGTKQYQNMLSTNGLNLVLEEYPPFTEEFLAKYPTQGPTETSEFMILGFRKKL